MNTWKDASLLQACLDAIDRITNSQSHNEVDLIVLAKRIRKAAQSLNDVHNPLGELIARFCEARGTSLLTKDAIAAAVEKEANNLTDVGLGSGDGNVARAREICTYLLHTPTASGAGMRYA